MPRRSIGCLPVGKRHPVHISFPIANEARLRPVLTRDEAQSIIDGYPALEVEEYQRAQQLARGGALPHRDAPGVVPDSVRIVKTFRIRIADISSRNKKPPVAYERILKEARERSAAELAVALGITPEDVAMLFEQRMGEAREN